MSFKSGVKGRGSDRWWERRWWLWCGDMRRMRWARRRVNTMRLTEWRRELLFTASIQCRIQIDSFR